MLLTTIEVIISKVIILPIYKIHLSDISVSQKKVVKRATFFAGVG